MVLNIGLEEILGELTGVNMDFSELECIKVDFII